jgi:hypothetical protein
MRNPRRAISVWAPTCLGVAWLEGRLVHGIGTEGHQVNG